MITYKIKQKKNNNNSCFCLAAFYGETDLDQDSHLELSQSFSILFFGCIVTAKTVQTNVDKHKYSRGGAEDKDREEDIAKKERVVCEIPTIPIQK